MRFAAALVLILLLATSAFGLEQKAYQFKEDFGTEALYDCALQYYYFIPCPTYAWFWAFSGWSQGDIIGTCFEIGNQGTGGWDACDPDLCQTLEQVRVLDFAGYGTVYVGWFTFELDAYCAPEPCCGPTEPLVHIWNSGGLESHFGWNYYVCEDSVCLSPCWENPFPGHFGIVITATMTGNYAGYPAWGADNISTPVATGCVMHDLGCLPVAYPRGWCGGSDPKVKSGYIGAYPFEFWPPLCLLDGGDTTPDGSQYGCVELAWRIYLVCAGPTAAEPSSWGKIKSMYE